MKALCEIAPGTKHSGYLVDPLLGIAEDHRKIRGVYIYKPAENLHLVLLTNLKIFLLDRRDCKLARTYRYKFRVLLE